MADKKISELTLLSDITGGEMIVVAYKGENYSVRLATLKRYFAGNTPTHEPEPDEGEDKEPESGGEVNPGDGGGDESGSTGGQEGGDDGNGDGTNGEADDLKNNLL